MIRSDVHDSTCCRAYHKLLGTVLTTSCISSNFLHSEQFLVFEKSEQLLALKMALLPYFNGLLDQCFFFALKIPTMIHTRLTRVSQVNKFYKISVDIDA